MLDCSVKGAGVKFVITPPGYTGKVPDGFEQLSTDTFTGYFLVRSNLDGHTNTRMCRNRSLTPRRSSSIRCRKSAIHRRLSSPM